MHLNKINVLKNRFSDRYNSTLLGVCQEIKNILKYYLHGILQLSGL